MKKLLIALLSLGALCGIAWLVNTEDVIIAVTAGTICVLVAALGFLWGEEIRHRLLSHRAHDPGAHASPVGAAVVMLFLGAVMLLAGNPRLIMPGAMLLLGAIIVIITGLVRRHGAGAPITRRPPTPMRSTPSWVPPSIPDRDRAAAPGDMGKTRPMPPA